MASPADVSMDALLSSVADITLDAEAASRGRMYMSDLVQVVQRALQHAVLCMGRDEFVWYTEGDCVLGFPGVGGCQRHCLAQWSRTGPARLRI